MTNDHKKLFYPPFKTLDLLTFFKRMYPLKCALQLKLKVTNGYLLCILEQNNSNCNYPGINSKSDFPTFGHLSYFSSSNVACPCKNTPMQLSQRGLQECANANAPPITITNILEIG